MKVCIIDYGLGNLTSVFNAVSGLNVEVCVSNKHKDIEDATHLILPGVGSFKEGMDNLNQLNLISILNNEVIDNKKPILGICLGMQLFSSFGHENELTTGLNWIKGVVRKMNTKNRERLPHVGWNDISIKKKSILVDNITESLIFYFLHSYQFIPKDTSVVSGVCDYAGGFVSIIESGNIFATQFHPEKSHNVGTQLIKNFLGLDNFKGIKI
jgi:glutamine amidotransferase